MTARARRVLAPGRNPKPAEIRALRESAGLSRDEFAALVHTSRRGLEKWETGERKMHPGLWELARRKLGYL